SSDTEGPGTVPIVRAMSPVFDPANRLVGVISIHASLASYFSSLAALAPADASVRIVSPRGTFQLQADPGTGRPRFLARSSAISDDFAGFNTVFGAEMLREAHGQLVGPSGEAYTLGVHDVMTDPITMQPALRIVYTSPVTSVNARALVSYPKVLITALVVMLVCALLASLFARTMARPLTLMARNLSRWTPDAVPNPLPVHRLDEIGLLAREFTRLLEQLGERHRTLQSEIADRRTAETAARAAELQMEAVIETMLDGLVVCDVQGHITIANPALGKMFGYTAPELIGQPITILMRPASRDGHSQFLRSPEQFGLGFDGLKQRRFAQRKDGEIFPIELVLNRFETVNGRFFSAVIRDRTSQLAMQAELERMAAAVESAADAIAIQDGDGNILYVNEACVSLLGIPKSELLGVRPQALKLSMDSPEHYQAMRETIERGEVWHGTLTQRGEGGRVVELDSTISPIRLFSSNDRYRICVMRDMTGQRQLERQLLQAQKHEAIGLLAAGIAHEINTPIQYVGDNLRFLKDAFNDIAPILGMLENLGTSTDEKAAPLTTATTKVDMAFLREEIPRALDQSGDGCQRIASIVKAMKEFSHPGADKSPVDLNRAIQSTITVATNEWKYVADVVTEMDRDLPPVTCVAGAINQVVLNMLVNAAHAISAVVGDGCNGKGTITVATQRSGEFAVIRISDTGTGISAEVRERIFDPFFTTKEVGRGTGQGLAIAHDVIVNKHGGSIGLESEVGKGSTFIIRIPIDASATSAVRAA
ncbi:MAG: PAS domain S-box protein, partial [Gammaproteobacteria bacterium]|nr:PAS domain S-box protein [Gammaproteobacteria bacterium]